MIIMVVLSLWNSIQEWRFWYS